MEEVITAAFIGGFIMFMIGVLMAINNRDGIWAEVWAILILLGAFTGGIIGFIVVVLVALLGVEP